MSLTFEKKYTIEDIEVYFKRADSEKINKIFENFLLILDNMGQIFCTYGEIELEDPDFIQFLQDVSKNINSFFELLISRMPSNKKNYVALQALFRLVMLAPDITNFDHLEPNAKIELGNKLRGIVSDIREVEVMQ